MKVFSCLIVGCFLLFFSSVWPSQVVLVTGASQGLGYSISECLAKEGYIVYGSVRKTSTREHILNLEKKYPSHFHVVTLDVTDQKSIDEAVKIIYDQEGKIDILVNNAGAEIYGSVENITIEEAQNIFDINFFGVMRVTQAVLPFMRQQQNGHIIQISSRSGFRPLPSLSIYAASKYAVEGLSETMAALLKPWHIHVSLIEPGPIRTNLDLNAPYGSRLDRQSDPYYPIFSDSGLLDPYSPFIQDPEEIAQIVKEAIKSPQPLFRYQTTDMIKKQAAKRFVDITGLTSIEEWNEVLFPSQPR